LGAGRGARTPLIIPYIFFWQITIGRGGGGGTPQGGLEGHPKGPGFPLGHFGGGGPLQGGQGRGKKGGPLPPPPPPPPGKPLFGVGPGKRLFFPHFLFIWDLPRALGGPPPLPAPHTSALGDTAHTGDPNFLWAPGGTPPSLEG